MFGYATDETEECMPLTVVLAHKINLKIAELRRSGEFWWARPDSKSQVKFAIKVPKFICISISHDVRPNFLRLFATLDWTVMQQLLWYQFIFFIKFVFVGGEIVVFFSLNYLIVSFSVRSHANIYLTKAHAYQNVFIQSSYHFNIRKKFHWNNCVARLWTKLSRQSFPHSILMQIQLCTLIHADCSLLVVQW